MKGPLEEEEEEEEAAAAPARGFMEERLVANSACSHCEAELPREPREEN